MLAFGLALLVFVAVAFIAWGSPGEPAVRCKREFAPWRRPPGRTMSPAWEGPSLSVSSGRCLMDSAKERRAFFLPHCSRGCGTG